MMQRRNRNDPGSPDPDIILLTAGSSQSPTSPRPIRKSRLRRKVKNTKKNNKTKGRILFLLLVFCVAIVLILLGSALVWLGSTGGDLKSPFILPAALRSNKNTLHSALDGKLPSPPLYNPNPDSSAAAAAADTQQVLLQLSPEALDMCTRTLWHTLETTTIVLPDQETFIHTGDIDDLWLRDSAAQIHPLLVRSAPNNNGKNGTSLMAQDPKLDRIVSGLIKRTSAYIRHDPYANAFRIDDSYKFSAAQKLLGRHDLISTWNYELDSACYWMRLLYFYWKESNGVSESAQSVLRLQSVKDAVDIMLDVWIAEQRHEDDDYATGPLLDCVNCNKPYRYPGLARDGKGTPTNATAGLTWTGFRPSDDECIYGYLIPANMFAVVVLEYMVDMATNLWNDDELAQKAETLATEIQRGIQEHAIVDSPDGNGKVYAYEVDGLGNHAFLDDANVPSLLSIPYLGYAYDKEIYANTRRMVLSPHNPTYRKGTNDLTGPIESYGSVHMSKAIKDNVWPMAMAVQGLASDDRNQKIRIIEQLVKASAGTGWMHESFSVSNPHKFTRRWFCWADSLFAELVMSVTDKCPSPDHKYDVLEWRDRDVIAGGQFALD